MKGYIWERGLMYIRGCRACYLYHFIEKKTLVLFSTGDIRYCDLIVIVTATDMAEKRSHKNDSLDVL